MNTACINAIAFDGEHSFNTGGYDAAVTAWTLDRPPSPPMVRDSAVDSAACASAESCFDTLTLPRGRAVQ